MKLWLLDADVIIDLLSLGIFDSLVERHDIYVATIVIDEVKSYKKDGVKQYIDFRAEYINTGRIKEQSAYAAEIDEQVLSNLPPIWQGTLNSGELESLAILKKNEDLIFCSCDAATIRALPFLDVSERGISVENLIKNSGLKQMSLEVKHTEEYFKNNLEEGKVRWIQHFKS